MYSADAQQVVSEWPTQNLGQMWIITGTNYKNHAYIEADYSGTWETII